MRLRLTGERAVKRGSVREVTGKHALSRATAGPIRTLVDASKDGGPWWFPQYAGTGFDPNQAHQGKVMADAMRARGWEVEELPRGETVTLDTLRGFDVVIRPAPYFCYSASEAIAYRKAVASGARLFLMGSAEGYDDRIADIFGLRFGGNRHISLGKIIPHSLTSGLELLAIPWVSVLEMPEESVVLAWGANGDPVLGYDSSYAGYVLFSGTSSATFEEPFMSKALEFLETYSAYDLQLQFLPFPIFVESTDLPSPVLICPEPLEVLPQPEDGAWVFRWEAVPGAQSYQITVLGPKASRFLVNRETTSNTYIRPISSSYIANSNAIGWRWSVRAQGPGGIWGNWSEERLFDVALMPDNCP